MQGWAGSGARAGRRGVCGPFPGTYLRAVAAVAGIGRHRPAPALIGGGERGALCKCRGGPPRSTARRTAAEVSAGTGGCGHGGNLGNRVHACPSSPCVGNWEPEPRTCCLQGGLCCSRLLLRGGQVGKGSCMEGWKRWGYTFLSWVMDRVDEAVCSHTCMGAGLLVSLPARETRHRVRWGSRPHLHRGPRGQGHCVPTWLGDTPEWGTRSLGIPLSLPAGTWGSGSHVGTDGMESRVSSPAGCDGATHALPRREQGGRTERVGTVHVPEMWAQGTVGTGRELLSQQGRQPLLCTLVALRRLALGVSRGGHLPFVPVCMHTGLGFSGGHPRLGRCSLLPDPGR